jgi:hypothetical protein
MVASVWVEPLNLALQYGKKQKQKIFSYSVIFSDAMMDNITN